MPLSDKINKVHEAAAASRSKPPVWAGPERDGITFSMLSRFLVCRERFRLLVVEGLKPFDRFNAKMEFGNLWHVAEEAFAKDNIHPLSGKSMELTEYEGKTLTHGFLNPLRGYAQKLTHKYGNEREQIQHWYDFAKAMFPIYIDYWAKHPDVKGRTPLLQEQVFDMPHRLPSGRVVRLRGKWDSVDLIAADDRGPAGIWIQENKTKSAIDPVKVSRQLTNDLQSMLYIIALLTPGKGESAAGCNVKGWPHGVNVLGVRYNVVRRSAHKSVESMLKKLGEDQRNGRIGEWFARFKVNVTADDVEKFRRQTLDPILEQLCDWYNFVIGPELCASGLRGGPVPPGYYTPHHWRHPFGVYNILDEGGSSDLDNYLETGNAAGLQRTKELFPELRSE